jgi:hypothetical protein
MLRAGFYQISLRTSVRFRTWRRAPFEGKAQLHSSRPCGEVICGLPDRQPAASVSIVRPMQEFLRQIDLEYYRSTRLLIVHAEIEQLRQVRPESTGVGARRRPRVSSGTPDVGAITRRTLAADGEP